MKWLVDRVEAMCKAICFAVTFVGFAAAAQEANDALLLDLMAAQGRAVARIETSHIVYEFETVTVATPESRTRSSTQTGSVEQWTRGGEARISYIFSNIDRSDKPLPPTQRYASDSQFEFVCNASYRAFWVASTGADLGHLSVTVHDRMDSPDEEAQMRDDMFHQWDPLRCAFRSNTGAMANRTLREKKEAMRPGYSMTANRGEVPNCFICAVYSNAVPDTPGSTITIDGARGYMTTALESDSSIYSDDPSLHDRETWKLTPMEAAPGIWLPSRIDVHQKRLDVETTTVVRVKTCEVNIPVDEALFHWQGLGYPGKEIVVNFPDGSGKRVALGMLDPDYIPEKPYVRPARVAEEDTPIAAPEPAVPAERTEAEPAEPVADADIAVAPSSLPVPTNDTQGPSPRGVVALAVIAGGILLGGWLVMRGRAA